MNGLLREIQLDKDLLMADRKPPSVPLLLDFHLYVQIFAVMNKLQCLWQGLGPGCIRHAKERRRKFAITLYNERSRMRSAQCRLNHECQVPSRVWYLPME